MRVLSYLPLLTLLLGFSVSAADKGNSLGIDGRLEIDDFIDSPNKKYRLMLEEDGNLALHRLLLGKRTLRVVWSSNTADKQGTVAVLQGDGNLVIYNSKNAPVWASGARPLAVKTGGGKCSLHVRDDGIVEIRAHDAKGQAKFVGQDVPRFVLWTSATDRLQMTQELKIDQQLRSPNGDYRLVMQRDGNLVLYKKESALWASGSQKSGENFAVLCPNGELQVRFGKSMSETPDSKVIWCSGARAASVRYVGGYCSLQLTNQGTLEILAHGQNGAGSAFVVKSLHGKPKLRSIASGTQVEVTWKNVDTVPINLHWIDGRGNFRSPGETILPGATFSGTSFAGHVFAITRNEDASKKYYTVICRRSKQFYEYPARFVRKMRAVPDKIPFAGKEVSFPPKPAVLTIGGTYSKHLYTTYAGGWHHVQGIARVGRGYVFSHNTRDGKDKSLLVKTNPGQAADFSLIGSKNHPGGIQAVGNVVVVPSTKWALKNDLDEAQFGFVNDAFGIDRDEPNPATIHLFDASSGQVLTSFTDPGSAGAAGIAYHELEKCYYVATDDGDVALYKSEPNVSLKDAKFRLVQRGGVGPGGQGGTQLIYDRIDNRLYLVALDRDRESGEDRVDFSEVTLAPDGLSVTEGQWESFAINKGGSLNGPNFRWAGAVYFEDDRLYIAAAHRTLTFSPSNPHTQIKIWASKDDLVTVYEDNNGWDGKGKKWLLPPGEWTNGGSIIGFKTRRGYERLPFDNDEVRALRVPAGFTVYMTDDDRFERGKHGTALVEGPVTLNVDSVNKSLAGKISSLRVTLQERTKVVERGDTLTIKRGDSNASGIEVAWTRGNARHTKKYGFDEKIQLPEGAQYLRIRITSVLFPNGTKSLAVDPGTYKVSGKWPKEQLVRQ